MDVFQETKHIAAQVTQVAAQAGEKIYQDASNAMHSPNVYEVAAVATLAATVLGRGAICAAVKRAIPFLERSGVEGKLFSEDYQISNLSTRDAIHSFDVPSSVTIPLGDLHLPPVGFLRNWMQSVPSDTSFAAKTGWSAAKSTSRLTFITERVPGVDKNSQVFHSDMADQLGVDLAKMNEGKISILHPRFRHPEKQLLGNARHRDLGLWGNNEQGVGVVEYEALPSKKGYLTSANSVVRVASRDNQFLPQNFASSTGSGVLVGRPEEGLVLTNKHVVNDAVSLSIKTLDGKNFSSKIVGIDPTHDLALIRIDDAPAGAVFPVAKLSQSDVLSRSTRVVGLGHPLGLPGLVASPGQYRYFDRSLKVDVLELDSMNYGSSGGGIFNQDGSLVGLMTKRLEASNAKGATWNLAGGMPVKYIREFLAANGVTGS